MRKGPKRNHPGDGRLKGNAPFRTCSTASIADDNAAERKEKEGSLSNSQEEGGKGWVRFGGGARILRKRGGMRVSNRSTHKRNGGRKGEKGTHYQVKGEKKARESDAKPVNRSGREAAKGKNVGEVSGRGMQKRKPSRSGKREKFSDREL